MTTEVALSQWLRQRKDAATALERKLARAAKWQKRYDILTDKVIETQIATRVARVMEIANKHSIGFNPLPSTVRGRIEATYSRGDVVLDLTTFLFVSYAGVVCMNFHSTKHNAYAFRISVGKTERVTDNILATLVGKK